MPHEAWAPQFLGVRWHDPNAAGHWILGAGIDDGVVALETLDDGRSFVEVLRGESRLHGPVAYAEGFVALVDGRWQSRLGGVEAAFVDQGERPWTCIDAVAGEVVVCEARALSRLEGPASEPTTRTYFALESLDGIDTSCLDAPMLDVPCTSQWLHFGAESGLGSVGAAVTALDASSISPGPLDAGRSEDASPAGEPAAAAPGPSPAGCAVTPARPGDLPRVAPTLLVVVLALRRRRPRRAPPNR
jgi:MYXO-CTERM domain-containing protein